MNSNTPQLPGQLSGDMEPAYPAANSATDSRKKWDLYYNSRDLTNIADLAGMLNKYTPAPQAPYISGPLGVGPFDSTVIETVPVQVNYRQHYPVHHPVDTRSRKERRAGRKRFRKAKAYYGKTYVFTRARLIWTLLALGVGMFLLSACATSLFALYVMGLGDRID